MTNQQEGTFCNGDVQVYALDDVVCVDVDHVYNMPSLDFAMSAAHARLLGDALHRAADTAEANQRELELDAAAESAE